MTLPLLALLLGGAYLATRRGTGSTPGGGKVGSVGGDGTSRSSPIIVGPDTDPASVLGKWYIAPDGTGPYRMPTDADLQAFGQQIADAAFHNRPPPAPPADWGPFSGWRPTTWKVAAPVGRIVGGAVGFLTGGPAGAAKGAEVGGELGRRIFS